MEILIANGYDVGINIKANYPFADSYVITIKEKEKENEKWNF